MMVFYLFGSDYFIGFGVAKFVGSNSLQYGFFKNIFYSFSLRFAGSIC